MWWTTQVTPWNARHPRYTTVATSMNLKYQGDLRWAIGTFPQSGQVPSSLSSSSPSR
jgi:hypothetical protein